MFERTDIDEVTVDDLFVDIESKILGRGLRGNRIGRRRGGNAGSRNPLKRVLRPAVYRAVDDADADGLIQDGTIHERPAKPKLEVPGSVLSGNPLNQNSPARELVSLAKKPPERKKPAKRKKGSAKADFDEILRVEEEDEKLAWLKLEEQAKAEALRIQARFDEINPRFRSANEQWEADQDIELARESLEVIASTFAENEDVWDLSRLAVSPREVAMARLQNMKNQILAHQAILDDLSDKDFEELLYNLLAIDDPDGYSEYVKDIVLQSAIARYEARGVDAITFSDELDPDIPWENVFSYPPISDSGVLYLDEIQNFVDSQNANYNGLLLEQLINVDPSDFVKILEKHEENQSRDLVTFTGDIETDEDRVAFLDAEHRRTYGHENAVAALSTPEGIALAEHMQSLFDSEFGADSRVAKLFEKFDTPTPVIILAAHGGPIWTKSDFGQNAITVTGTHSAGVITIGVVKKYSQQFGEYVLVKEQKNTERFIGDLIVKGGDSDHVSTITHEMGHAFHDVINNGFTAHVSLTDLSREWDELTGAYYSEMQALQDAWDDYQDESWEELSQLEDDWQSVMLGDPGLTWLNVKYMRSALDRAKESGYFEEYEEAEAERIIDAVTQLNIPDNQQISKYSLTNKFEAFAETFTAVMLDVDTEGLSDSAQALVDFMRRAIDGPRVSETSSFDGSYVPDSGVESSVSERISERFSPRDGFSGVRPDLSILEDDVWDDENEDIEDWLATSILEDNIDDDGSWDDLTPVATETVPGVSSDASVPKEVSNLLNKLKIHFRDRPISESFSRIADEYDDATVSAAATIFLDSVFDGNPISSLIVSPEISDLPTIDNNPTAELTDGLLNNFAKMDNFESVSPEEHDEQEVIFHNRSQGLHDVFERLNIDRFFSTAAGSKAVGTDRKEYLTNFLNAIFSHDDPREALSRSLLTNWELDNPMPKEVEDYEYQIKQNPDWFWDFNNGGLSGDPEVVELNSVLDGLELEEERLGKLVDEGFVEFEVEQLEIQKKQDRIYEILKSKVDAVTEEISSIRKEYEDRRSSALDEIKKSLPADLENSEGVTQEEMEVFVEKTLDSLAGQSVLDAESFSKSFAKQFSARSSAEALVKMIEADPSVRDVLNRIFEQKVMDSAIPDREMPLYRSINRFEAPIGETEDKSDNTPAAQILQYVGGRSPSGRQIKTSDFVSDKIKAAYIFDLINKSWADGSSVEAKKLSSAMGSLLGARDSEDAKDAHRRDPQSLEDYRILATAMYSSTQSYLRELGIAEDSMVILSRAQNSGPREIVETPETQKLQLEIEKRKNAALAESERVARQYEIDSAEFAKFHENAALHEALRARSANEALSAEQEKLVKSFGTLKEKVASAQETLDDIQDLISRLDSDQIWKAQNAASGRNWSLPSIYRMNGLSSFGTVTQREFGSSVYHMAIPASRIFSISFLGLGALGEYEVVVLGDGDDAAIYERQGGAL